MSASAQKILMLANGTISALREGVTGGGGDLIALQNILSHKSLSMTQRYAHLIPEHIEKSRQIMQDFCDAGVLQSGDT
ncbi:MAG: hypothetical protein NTW38_09540 [Candidatus Aminicenantes bacterium]|nr:hypothetical protein [Candidatus Aminicenantes bacterium]